MENQSRRRVLASLGGALASTSAVAPASVRRPPASRPSAHRQRRSQGDFETFGAWLTGENQLPPVETEAFGFATFRVAPDESRIDYWLVVASIENVEESHVHKGPPDLNGNVVAYLFGPAEEPVSKTGLLASGTLTDAEMIWPLTDAAGMTAQMREANVYVNVHTTEHPAGEIRGQIRPTGVP